MTEIPKHRFNFDSPAHDPKIVKKIGRVDDAVTLMAAQLRITEAPVELLAEMLRQRTADLNRLVEVACDLGLEVKLSLNSTSPRRGLLGGMGNVMVFGEEVEETRSGRKVAPVVFISVKKEI